MDPVVKRTSRPPSKHPSGHGRKRMRLGEILIAAGKVTQLDIDAALGEQRRHPGRRLGEILVSRGTLSEAALVETMAGAFGVPFVDLTKVPVDPQALALVPAAVVLKYHVLPIALRGGALVLAVGDTALDGVDAARLSSRHPIEIVVATPSQIAATIASLFHPTAEATAAPGGLDAILKELSPEQLREVSPEAGETSVVSEQSGTVIRLVNQIFVDAYRRDASDIHIEPNGAHEQVLVRMRVDGECFVYHRLPAPLGPPVTARVKIMAELDIAERRKPQDGKVRFLIGKTPLELRVAVLPTVGGNEDVVLRLLPASKPRPLEQMALSDRNLRELKKMLAEPYGLILCVGPTGSGKTTTLHSALGSINTPDLKIWTAEDPVEITQPGLRQVQVNHKIGFDFATAMRSFLRADPDVIMVGEMRDKETATTAIEASLTGHLVLSTLHTNNAPETVVRLLEMGLDPFGFADSLLGILAQRLVRRLCVECRSANAPTAAESEAMVRAFGGAKALGNAFGVSRAEDLRVWNAPGCEACGGSGHKGRLALHELLVADDDLRAVVARRGTMDETRALAARSGMGTLLQDGVAKAVAGDTNLRQVLAVCNR